MSPPATPYTSLGQESALQSVQNQLRKRVILNEAKDLTAVIEGILRFAQDDDTRLGSGHWASQPTTLCALFWPGIIIIGAVLFDNERVSKMDLSTWLGLIIGIGGILGGQVLEGGHVGSIVQVTAAIIVFGGTLGAVMVGSPMEDLKTGVGLLKKAFFGTENKRDQIIAEILDAAQTARKESILALERKLSTFSNEYMRMVFRFVIDGIDAKTIKEIFESEIYLEEEHLNAGAKVFNDAGGFSPTIGIIGAVLGLIHVMENLSDTSKLGAGIAVAFVATVYGVGAANLIFLPLANKMKRKIKNEAAIKEMILTGALGIVAGLNPFIIEQKIRAYSHTPRKKEGGAE